MTITSFDIKKHQFKKTLRGYEPSEVLAFLEMVAAELEESQKQNKELSQKILQLETQLKDYKNMEKALQQTFMQAQETSGKAVEHARGEAQLIIQQAEVKASQIVDKARNELIALKEQLIILKTKKDSIVKRLKMVLNSELDFIKALEADEEVQSPNGESTQTELSKEKAEIEEIIKSLGQ